MLTSVIKFVRDIVVVSIGVFCGSMAYTMYLISEYQNQISQYSFMWG